MRGKEYDNTEDDEKLRITPAHAGKSEFYDNDEKSIVGSPPHMRGKGSL